MALSSYESSLLITVRGQNLLGNMLRRVGTDINALSKNVAAANANAAAVQSRIVSNTAQSATMGRGITTSSLALAGKRATLEEDLARNLKSSEAARVDLYEKEKGLLADISIQEAARLEYMEKLQNLGYSGMWLTNPKNTEQLTKNANTGISQLAYRLQASRLDLEKMNSELLSMPAQLEKINVQEGVNLSSYDRQTVVLAEQQKQLDIQKIALGELDAETLRLTEQDLVRAEALQKQAAYYEKMNRLATVGGSVSAVGRTAQFAGLIGTAVLGGMAYYYSKFATDTELAATQMSKIAGKGYGDVNAQAQVLQTTIEKMMTEFPASASDMATSAYNIFSGIPGLATSGPQGIQKGLALVQAANEMAVAGQTDLGTATTGLIRIMNDFGKTGGSVDQMLNTTFAIIRAGHVHLADLVSMLNNIGPAALGAGQSLKGLGPIIAEATLHMGPSMASTGISRLLQQMQKAPFIQGAAKYGVDVDVKGTDQLKPLLDILDEFAAKYPQLTEGGEALANFFKNVTSAGGSSTGNTGTIQAQRVLNVLMRNLPQVHQLMKQIDSDNYEFERSYSAMAQSSGVKWNILVNTMKSGALAIGQAVFPVVYMLVSKVADLVKWFDQLSPPVKSLIGNFAIWGAVGLLLGGTLLHITGSVISLIASVGKLIPDLIEMAGAISLSDIAWTAFGIAVIAAAALAVYFITHWSTAQRVWAGIVNVFKTDWQGVWESIEGATLIGVAKVITIMSSIVSAVHRIAADIGKSLGGKIAGLLGLPKGWGQWVGGKVGSLGADILGFGSGASSIAGLQPFVNSLTREGGKLVSEGGKKVSAAFWQGYYEESLKQQIAQAGSLQKLFDEGLPTSKKSQLSMFMEYLQDPSAFFDKYEKGLKNATDIQNLFNAAAKNGAATLKQVGDQAGTTAADIAQAGNAEETKINSMVSKLESVYNNFQTQASSIVGTLFQGNVMQGPIGQAYSQLAQFGVAPPANILKQDLESQVQMATRYKTAIAKLIKEGAPKALIDQFYAQGQQGELPVIGLAAGSAASFRSYIKTWKQSIQIGSGLTSQMWSNQVAEWKSYGKATMLAILQGLTSQQTYLGKGFKYVLSKSLGTTMRNFINSEFPNLVKLAEQKELQILQNKQAAKAAAKDKVIPGSGVPPSGGSTSNKAVNPQVTINAPAHFDMKVYGDTPSNISSIINKALFDYKTGTRRTFTQVAKASKVMTV